MLVLVGECSGGDIVAVGLDHGHNLESYSAVSEEEIGGP